MSDPAQFESEVGQNVHLSDNRREAKWSPTQSGGWAYCACAMKPGESVTMNLEGSGHCDVGIIKENPNAYNQLKKEIKMTKLNGVKLHKRTCKITLALKDSGKEMCSTFNGDHVSRKVDKSTQIWIAAYVKFGTITMDISNGSSVERLPFSDNHGPNVELNDGNHKASTISASPASQCLVKIKVGETIKLKCSPITDGSHDPSRYHLKLQVTDNSPGELKRHYPQMFDPLARPGRAAPLTTLELLEKEDCKGNITISLCKANIIEYTTASNKRNTQGLQYVTSYGVSIVVDLFRVSVVIKDRTNTKSVELGRIGVDTVDSRVQEPMNEFAENSLNVAYSCTPARAPGQDYVSVTEAKEIMNNNNIYNKNNNNYRANICPFGTNTLETGMVQRMDKLEATQSRIVQTQEEMLAMMQAKAPPEIPACPRCSLGPSAPYDEVDSQSLQPHWVELVNTMRADRLCDHLYAKDVISEHDMSEVFELSKTNQKEANRRLLDILRRKHVRKSLMCTILEEAEEAHLKPLMFPQ